MTVGERIRAARKKAGLTQKELGEQCGIAEPTIRRYELGKLNPKIETLKKIAEPLGIPVYQLYGDEIKQFYIEGVLEGTRMTENRPVVLAEEEVLHPYREKGYQFDGIEVLFISELNKLNEFGQLVALNTIREIAKKKEYQCIDYRQLKEADDDAPQDNP